MKKTRRVLRKGRIAGFLIGLLVISALPFGVSAIGYDAETSNLSVNSSAEVTTDEVVEATLPEVEVVIPEVEVVVPEVSVPTEVAKPAPRTTTPKPAPKPAPAPAPAPKMQYAYEVVGIIWYPDASILGQREVFDTAAERDAKVDALYELGLSVQKVNFMK